MKKHWINTFSKSTLGIILFTIIPSLITYTTSIKVFKTKIYMTQHLPFIITMSVAIFILIFLIIRKYVLSLIDRINGLEECLTTTIIKQKYYDIMIAKYRIRTKEWGTEIVRETDTIFFTDFELSIIRQYENDINDLKERLVGKGLV